MTSQQMTNLLTRYGVTTERNLIRAIRDEYATETGVRYTLAEAAVILDHMLEAEYQRIEGGAYDTPVRLFGEDDAVTCFVCYHHEHPESVCGHNDDAWLDPLVGGDPDNTPRPCGCTESVNRAQRNAIVIRVEK